jgi:putative ABC transport system permease protein
MERKPRRSGRLFRPAPGAEVHEELEFHLEARIRENIERGMDPEAARAAALARFGNVAAREQECAELLAAERRGERRRDWLGDLRQDVQFGVRSAVRAPLFSMLAILTLALGIGANAAVFGVVKSVLLDSLPYSDAGELVRIYSDFQNYDRSSVSAGAATDLAARLRTASAVAGFNFSTFDATWVDDGAARLIPAASVTPNFFATLGVNAMLGRTFADEDLTGQVLLISHGAWQREFGGDADVIGRTMQLGTSTWEIIGVLPAGFAGPMGPADLWFPLNLEGMLADPASARGQHWMGVIARLRPGATLEALEQDLRRMDAELAAEHPDHDQGRRFVAVPIRDAMVGQTRTPLLVLLASAALVLLITCANLAGALLSRTITRRREFAVRVALGARRGRLIRQLLTESALIAAAGAAAGLALAALGLGAVRELATTALPAYADLSLDGGLVLITVAAALLTALAFGLAPALAAGSWQPQGTLREESRNSTESRRAGRLRGVLVAAQIALSLSLLTGAGLLVRSLDALTSAPLGFNPDGVMTARVQLPAARYETEEDRTLFFRELQERFAALPGVEGVASVTQLPSSTMSSNVLTVEGLTLPGDGPTFIPYMSVSDDYFDVARIPLLRGRRFGPEETPDGTPSIIISETMARRYWDGDALGRRLRVSPHTAERWGVIVGIVADVRLDPAIGEPEAMAYASNRQDAAWNGRDFLLRTAGDPGAVVNPMRRTLADLDPLLPLRHPRTWRDIVAERMTGRRLPVLLMSAFGLLALILSSVGVYAMSATMTAAREREFGVRMALGSSRSAIAGLVVRQGAAWMAAGLLGGMLGVLLIGRMIAGLLYDVAPLDPLTIVLAVCVLLLSAAIAVLVPVRRATRADPVAVLH